uniref:NADH-ubiquinone oxidoreductase chain 1 n=1 Tax=Spinolyprops cribricollis TaxID=2984372 RepID=A0A978AZX3_9CUCU|nr:NADH dehydrogenase subunit 1 [Spinolyprops cribricollis]UYB79068.1 NADH dehydrogenase subunit 1 [Spinolyprops cribricollis]
MFMLDLILIVIEFLVVFLTVLVGVAFLTLLERKVLGYIQIRKGPNKVGFLGILQPFGDAIKLFSKEQTFPYMSNMNIYYICPIFSLMISLFMWIILPLFSGGVSFCLSLLFFLVVSSLGVYSIMMAGWSSNSNYSLLGSLRSVAQTISYEVSMSIILLSFMYYIGGFNLLMFFDYQKFIWMLLYSLPLVFMLFISCLAETNRTPFDFAEGESELVSGFNVEYSSGGFALIFMAEYSSILFMSFIVSMVSLGGNINSYFFIMKVVLLSFLFLWVRGTLPRFRYDKLMSLTWKSFLPCSLIFLGFSLGMKIFILMN